MVMAIPTISQHHHGAMGANTIVLNIINTITQAVSNQLIHLYCGYKHPWYSTDNIPITTHKNVLIILKSSDTLNCEHTIPITHMIIFT